MSRVGRSGRRATGTTAPGDPPGLDVARVADYLAGTVPGWADHGTTRARLLVGGRSNLTYEVTDGAGTTVVVRRPPLGHVLATAHDMTREYTVIRALGPTGVPVPRAYALCPDPTVTGAPFYVMEKVDGTPYRRAEQVVALGADRTRAICTTMVDTLAALHAVDLESVGLSAFGRPDGFLARQVRRWKRQLDASHSRALAGAEELHAALTTRVPERSAAAIVHGDFRLDNLLVNQADQVTAVLDWEMATVGDPLTDVGLLLVHQDSAAAGPGAVSTVSSAPGYLSARQIMTRYAERSGRDLSDLDFYLGLAFFKLAAIIEGIHYRHSHQQTVGAGFDAVGAAVEPLLAAGLHALGEPI